MPTITPNFGLKKPLGNEVVNRQAYNENLELLDQKVAKKTDLDAHLTDYTQEVKSDSKQSVTLPHGLSVLNATRTAQLKPKFKGRQLVNLLGRNGNCEDLSKWSPWQSTLALDTANKVYGTCSIKITGTAVGASTCGKANISFKANKYYLILADVKNGTVGDRIRIGRTTGFNSIPVTSLSTTLFKSIYHKFTIGASDVVDGIEIQGFNTSIGQYFYVDGIRLYEITQAEYNEIDTLTPAQIAERYPYVDSFQCVQNPAVRVEGENLLPPFNQVPGLTVNSLYKATKVAQVAYPDDSLLLVNAVPNQQYTFSCKIYGYVNSSKFPYVNIAALDSSHSVIPSFGYNIEPIFDGEEIKQSFIVPSTAKYIRVLFTCNAVDTYVFENPMLVLGDTLPTEFKPYNPSYLYLQTPLYDGETLEEIDGNWVRTKKWEKKVFDGGYTVGIVTSPAPPSGCKKVYLNDVALLAEAYNKADICIKYDGTVLRTLETIDNTRQDEFYIASTKSAYITVANTDSGWGENYTPTADEIKAYFNGWRMSDVSSKTVLYSSGVKHWHKIKKSEEASITTLPTMSYSEWTPYTLHYQLATPTTEVVPHDGELALHEGTNQVEVFGGVVVRELANPLTSGDNIYYINHIPLPNGKFRYSVKRVINIYKGKINDTTNWSLREGHFNYYSGVGAFTANYDTTAQYSVTYLSLPEEFTAPLLSVDATYDSNIKSTVDTLVDELAKVTTDVTALEMALREKGLLRKTPICRVGITKVQAIPNNTQTKAQFDKVVFDTDSIGDISNSRFLIRTRGNYSLQSNISFANNATGIRGLYLKVNNGTSAELMLIGALSGDRTWLTSSTILSLNIGDTVEFYVYQTSGGTLSLEGLGIAIVKVGD